MNKINFSFDKVAKSMIAEARTLYGKTHETRSLRHQWVKKTFELKSRGIHVLQNGKFPGITQAVRDCN